MLSGECLDPSGCVPKESLAHGGQPPRGTSVEAEQGAARSSAGPTLVLTAGPILHGGTEVFDPRTERRRQLPHHPVRRTTRTVERLLASAAHPPERKKPRRRPRLSPRRMEKRATRSGVSKVSGWDEATGSLSPSSVSWSCTSASASPRRRSSKSRVDVSIVGRVIVILTSAG